MPRAKWFRCRSLVTVKRRPSGPEIAWCATTPITAADINGGPAPGYSSGQAQAAMERLAAARPAERRELRMDGPHLSADLAGNTAHARIPAGVLLVFLVLAAQYESLTLPLAVILIVPMCLLCAITGRLAHRRRQQHLHADRLDRAGGPGLQERDPDRGVRARAGTRKGGDTRSQAAIERERGCGCARFS
jgi:hypothetical protein